MTWNRAAKCKACDGEVDGPMMHLLEDGQYDVYHVRCLSEEQVSRLAERVEFAPKKEVVSE